MIEHILNEGIDTNYPIKFIIKDNCWECISHKQNKGYPRVSRNGRLYGMHRYVYELYNDYIGEGFVIMHTCDNTLCINPEHLKLGTQKENMEDMANKGRSLKGSKRSDEFKSIVSKNKKGLKQSTEHVNKRISKAKETQKKLTIEQVAEIRNMLKYMKQKEIAKIFNVSIATISNIKNGKSSYDRG